MTWLRRHLLLVVVLALGALSFAAFTWSEWGYFCDQQHQYKQRCGSFWSHEHVHDWLYNAASNWQAELLFGILLVVVLHKAEGPDGADREHT